MFAPIRHQECGAAKAGRSRVMAGETGGKKRRIYAALHQLRPGLRPARSGSTERRSVSAGPLHRVERRPAGGMSAQAFGQDGRHGAGPVQIATGMGAGPAQIMTRDYGWAQDLRKY